MEWSNEVTLEFLRLYEQEPAIWNPKDPMHKNRNAVADAWQRIEVSLSIECPVKELKKKKESLMATFRPLLNKVKASMKTGSGADNVYKPSWFAYETMAKFLQGIYQPRTTISTQELEDVTRVDDTEQNEEEKAENTIVENNGENYDDTEIRSKTANTFKSPSDRGTRKRKGSKIETIQNHLEEAYKIMKNVYEKPDRDECSLYGELLTKKLRAFDENARDILMHEIDNLVFCAKMQKQNQHIQPLPSPSYSSHPFGDLHSNAHTVNTYNYPSFSYDQHRSHISLPSPSHSRPSPGNSPFSQPSPGHSNSSSQPSPAHSYYSQHSPGNASISQPTTTGIQASALPSEIENTPEMAS